MNELIGQYAPQIVLLVLAALAYKIVEILFSRRARILYFVTEVASFTFKGPQGNYYLINTHRLVLQNVGRAIAENVQIIHDWLPPYVSVSPSMKYDMVQLEGDSRGITLDRIYPQQTVVIAYLYFTPPPNVKIVSDVRAKDHLGKRIDAIFSRRHPKWVAVMRQILTLVGGGLVLYLAYWLGVALLKLVTD